MFALLIGHVRWLGKEQVNHSDCQTDTDNDLSVLHEPSINVSPNTLECQRVAERLDQKRQGEQRKQRRPHNPTNQAFIGIAMKQQYTGGQQYNRRKRHCGREWSRGKNTHATDHKPGIIAPDATQDRSGSQRQPQQAKASPGNKG